MWFPYFCLQLFFVYIQELMHLLNCFSRRKKLISNYSTLNMCQTINSSDNELLLLLLRFQWYQGSARSLSSGVQGCGSACLLSKVAGNGVHLLSSQGSHAQVLWRQARATNACSAGARKGNRDPYKFGGVDVHTNKNAVCANVCGTAFSAK